MFCSIFLPFTSIISGAFSTVNFYNVTGILSGAFSVVNLTEQVFHEAKTLSHFRCSILVFQTGAHTTYDPLNMNGHYFVRKGQQMYFPCTYNFDTSKWKPRSWGNMCRHTEAVHAQNVCFDLSHKMTTVHIGNIFCRL